MNVQEAMNVLTEALANDDEYAYGWHANIAMACSDAISSADIVDENCAGDLHAACNDAASRFMKICFDVETSHEMLLKV